MRIKQLAAVLAIGIGAAGTFNNANAQVTPATGNTGTQHTTPTAAQRAQQDSINRSRDMEAQRINLKSATNNAAPLMITI